MAVASPSLVRLALPRTMLRASCLTASSQAQASCSSSQSMTYTRLPLRLSKCRAASLRSPPQRRFSMTSRQRRPPQPTPPVGAPAAEPAVVKSPADPPNPASWPGLQKKAGSDAQRSSASQHDPFAGSSEKQGGTASVPHAESSKGALERQQREAAQGEDTGSTNSDAAACATLSPSSPASPRSQGKEKASAASTADETSSAPKAVAPEDSQTSASSKTSGGSKFAAPNASGKAFRAKKEALTLSPTAVERLQELLQSESGPRLIRIGVRNKGCAGMSYHLEYVTPDQAGKFDERVRQDGVEVLIDSKALFSIIGSEMDWKEDTLSAKFVFNNPNVKESCGCGESFLT